MEAGAVQASNAHVGGNARTAEAGEQHAEERGFGLSEPTVGAESPEELVPTGTQGQVTTATRTPGPSEEGGGQDNSQSALASKRGQEWMARQTLMEGTGLEYDPRDLGALMPAALENWQRQYGDQEEAEGEAGEEAEEEEEEEEEEQS
jgi:hypothetical protein